MNRASVFEWHKRFKESRESVRDDERCGRKNRIVVLKKKTLQLYFKTFIEKINSGNLII